MSKPDLHNTLDPHLRSWVVSANLNGAQFPIQNLPLGIFSAKNGPRSIGIAIGDQILDVGAFAASKFGAAFSDKLRDACSMQTLNALMSLDQGSILELRSVVSQRLSEGATKSEHIEIGSFLIDADACAMHVPAQVGDYTDFYASLDHATNVGKMFRPDAPLLPNYKYVPIGYHGRASSIVQSGTPVHRPFGQIKEPNELVPVYRPTGQLDYELEVGWFIRGEHPIGSTLTVEEARRRIFGLCLLNDWSARDIQAWEYQPLGPFLAKNFTTSISPWVVTAEALEPFRVPAVVRNALDPKPLPYLDSEVDKTSGGLSIVVEVLLLSKTMRDSGLAPMLVSTGNFSTLYWTIAQMTAHHASSGCNLRPGDLLSSGTISGPSIDSRGCLLEITDRGTNPLPLPSGEERRFLEEGDEVIFRARCERAGYQTIGFGECRGSVQAN